MANRNETSSGGHWYLFNQGQVQAAHHLGLAGARTCNAFPSVTTVLKERANEGLIIYLKRQVFTAMLENKRKKGETEDAYRERIFELAKEHSLKAADFGTALHDAMEAYPQAPLDEKLRPYFEHFARWHEEHVVERIAVEAAVADPDIGVAGCVDLIAVTRSHGLAVIDFKTSEFKYGKARFWPSYRAQLAFYAVAWQKKMGLPRPPAILNLGINSAEPMPCQHKAYTVEEQTQAYRDFLATAYLWFSAKNYWPVGQRAWGLHMQVDGKLLSA